MKSFLCLQPEVPPIPNTINITIKSLKSIAVEI